MLSCFPPYIRVMHTCEGERKINRANKNENHRRYPLNYSIVPTTNQLDVLTLTHRYNAVRGHRAGSNNSATENYLRRKTNKNRR